MRACKNLECPFIRSNRKAARFDDEVTTCTHCGKPLSASFVPEAADARHAPTELRGVPVDSLGLCIGSWCPVIRERTGTVAGIVAAVLVAIAGLGALAAGQIVGVVLLVLAGAGGTVLAIVNRGAAVRLYDRGFEYQRGSVQIGIAYAKLRSASMSITEHRVNGVRASWQLRLDVAWDVGSLTLFGREPGRSPTPDGPFHDFAVQVVRAYQAPA